MGICTIRNVAMMIDTMECQAYKTRKIFRKERNNSVHDKSVQVVGNTKLFIK